LFVTTPAEEALLAAIEAAHGLPAVSVATAVATDALAGLIASAQTPADLVRQALQGLVPLSREDGRIVDVVAARPATAPLLRSAFEGFSTICSKHALRREAYSARISGCDKSTGIASTRLA
jgi:hypothetical protein